ncbi:hypothetical protein [Sorangium sp. So ce388]|uniref:hypothetical protein n=1 Tax=Sorangium sp. So ce388 TaxID=3133309 RepID=UPI003F5CA15C
MGFSLDDVETTALLAVPGLRRRHVEVSAPRPDNIRVRLYGPAARGSTAEVVYQAIWSRVPLGLTLEVEAVVTVEAAARA